jgi:hypothetical protein
MTQDDVNPILEADNNVEEKIVSSSVSWDRIVEKSIEYGFNLPVSRAVLIIGLILAKRLSKMYAKILKNVILSHYYQDFWSAYGQ